MIRRRLPFQVLNHWIHSELTKPKSPANSRNKIQRYQLKILPLDTTLYNYHIHFWYFSNTIWSRILNCVFDLWSMIKSFCFGFVRNVANSRVNNKPPQQFALNSRNFWRNFPCHISTFQQNRVKNESNLQQMINIRFWCR